MLSLCLVLRKKRPLHYWLIHLSLIILIGGGFLTSSFSFRKTIEVKEKNTVSIPQTPYHLKLSRFNITYYQDNKNPKAFSSEITIYEDKKKLANGKIMVNCPFSFRGFTFFQKGYEIADYSFVLNIEGEEFLIKNIGDELKKGNMRIKVCDFLPDFVMVDRIPTNRSFSLNNPALKMIIKRGNKTKVHWLFLNFPRYHLKDIDLKFEQIIPNTYFSYIEIVKDPGIPLIFTAFSLFALGLIWKQYFSN